MENEFTVSEITENAKKSSYTREVLENLPEWFGNRESLEEYVENVSGLPYWAAFDNDGKCLGFFSVRIHYGHTGDIFVCGVLPEYHHAGIGKALYHAAEKYFIKSGCKYVIVETLSDKADYEPYARTRRFYESVGFEPLITLTEMWDANNPCLIMFKSLI